MPSTENYITQAAGDARYQALGSLGSSTPESVDAGDTGSAGVSSSAARQDHEHPVAITSAQLVPAAAIAAWASYVPSNTNVTVGNGTQEARFVQLGKTVHWSYRLIFGTTTAIGGNAQIGLPVAAAQASNGIAGPAYMEDATAADFLGVATTTSSGAQVLIRLDNSTAVANTTAPFTWTTSDALIISGTYEAA